MDAAHQRQAAWHADPAGRYTQRYWDGQQYTQWVLLLSGEVVEDSSAVPLPADPIGVPPTDPKTPSRVIPPRPMVERGLRAHAGSSSGERHKGDVLLDVLSTVTLMKWINGGISAGLFIPQLTELAKARRGDLRTLVWLGLRLQECEQFRERFHGSYLWGPSAIVRPVTKPLMRKAATAISSGDGRPASAKVLGPTWEALRRRVQGPKPTGADLCLLARIHLEAGDPAKAWEIAAAACQVSPTRSEAPYILAEAMYDAGDYQNAWIYAGKALEGGCSLARALLRQDTGIRRQAWRKRRRGFDIPTVDAYWAAGERYYEGADPAQIFHFLGPSPLAA